MADLGWARRIEQRLAAGERVPECAVKAAAEVLQRPLLRGGPHAARPDTRDLQAGDHDHGDGWVPL